MTNQEVHPTWYR